MAIAKIVERQWPLCIVAEIKFSDIPAVIGAQVIPLFDIPAGAYVRSYQLQPVTVFNTTGAATVSVGTVATPTKYISGFNLKTAVAYVPPTTITLVTGAKLAATEKVVLTVNLADLAATTGEFFIMMEYLRGGGVGDSTYG